MDNQTAIDLLLAQLGREGIATAACKNGDRLIAISRDRLVDLLKQVDEKGTKAAIILIQSPANLN